MSQMYDGLYTDTAECVKAYSVGDALTMTTF